MSSGGSPTVGPQGFNPPTPQEWSALAKRGGDPVLLDRESRAILDASPIFVSADGHMRCLDTDETIAQRKSARIALADSLERYAGLTPDGADGLVNSIFVRQHPEERFADTAVLDPGMLRVAAALFEHQDTARRLVSFTKTPYEDRLSDLLRLQERIVALETSPSAESPSSAKTTATASLEDVGELKHAFSVLFLAHLRLVRAEMWRRPLSVATNVGSVWRDGLRTASAETIGPLLAELKPYADTIYGPPTKARDFSMLAKDLATVRMPEEFIRDSQIKTANISEEITGDRVLMNALENLGCYMVARTWTSEMREGLMSRGELDLSYGEPMGIRDDEHGKRVAHSVVTRVNEIACREYDIPLVPLRFQPEGTASEDKQAQTAGEYSLETRDIYLNFDHVLKEVRGGAPGVIGTLVHEITHAYQHALALGTTKHRVPPAVRDAGAIFDFNVANYAPGEAVSLEAYRRQPMERHAHYVGYTVQRNLERALQARGARRGLGQELSEEQTRIVSAWTLSSTESNPKNPPQTEREAMSRGAILPRQPDTIPPWQRSAQKTDKPSAQETDETDSNADD